MTELEKASAAVSDEAVIRIENLQKAFGDNVVLRDINLEVRRGEVVVVLGPSGSGKSTMLRCINLLETPTGGRIYFEDTEITAKKVNINEVRARVGMVFQNFNLFPHLSAKKNVMLAQQKVLKRSKEEAEQVAIARLTEVGLAERMDYMPSQLSGGQQQRVAIARAIVSRPGLILADEPTGNLDSKNGSEVINLLSQLHREGATIVMVTHSTKDASHADYIINLFDGQVVENLNDKM